MKNNPSSLARPGTMIIKDPAKLNAKLIAANAAIASRTSLAAAPTITVLRAQGAVTRKVYYLDSEGQVDKDDFRNATWFTWHRVPVSDITSLAALVQDLSKEVTAILIRGSPVGIQLKRTRRNQNNFAEPDEGCRWLMLDFDGIAVPAGISPIEPAAIEALIQKLPAEFHGVTYFYQFSSSAGILKPDGEPLKAGVSAHVFFWLNRPVHGKDLAAWLRLHCIETGFLERYLSSDGRPMIRYGFDEAVLRDIQPHYVALPEIREGVDCVLAPEHRQRLVEKASHAVVVPDFDPGLRAQAAGEHARLRVEWQRECGGVPQRLLTKVRGGGVLVENYYGRPASVAPATGREFDRAEVKRTASTAERPGVGFATLYFVNEKSPGSWWVGSNRPTWARRFGDDEAVPLKELSEGAYAYVRDELKWFEEIVHRELSLTAEGFLPAFNTFVRARNTLILAPTGSGKTAAFCEYAMQRCRTDIIVYAAQTKALTRQMVHDLQSRSIPTVHYKSYRKGQLLHPGVYVTTNKSLERFVEQMKRQAHDTILLVIDEAHVAIDDFMRSERTNRLLEDAVRSAEQTIFMTGTITELQVRKISDSIEEASGALTSTNFEFCEFSSLRSYTLRWADERRFGADIVALMRSHQALRASGQEVPRTVMIVGTSKMRPFELLLEHFGLLDDAMVVSRLEGSPRQIEEARISSKPWLVSSPLFAIGLNFDHPPTRLWAHLGVLQVDESQIVQTVNRANRTALECEVRLYAGKLDPLPYADLDHQAEADLIESYLLGEVDVQGVIDQKYQLDRMTYLQLRKAQEKITAKALYQLKSTNTIQNYTIVEQWEDDLHSEPDDLDLFKSMFRQAGVSYDEDVLNRFVRYAGETPAVLFEHLRRNKETSRLLSDDSDAVPKDFTDEQRALLAAVTGRVTQAKRSGGAEYPVLARLHAEFPPFFTEQFSADKTENWRIAIPHKIESLIEILGLLERLRAGKIDGVEFGKKLRLKGVRQGVLALAKSESDFIEWQRNLAKLDKFYAESRTASQQLRLKLDKVFFETARVFLSRIGVDFEKTTGTDRRSRLDPTKPIVPDWDFDEMRLALEILAESIEQRPAPSPDALKIEQNWSGSTFARTLCNTCVHCSLTFQCALGRPIDYLGDGVERTSEECEKFKKLSARVLKLKTERDRQKT